MAGAGHMCGLALGFFPQSSEQLCAVRPAIGWAPQQVSLSFELLWTSSGISTTFIRSFNIIFNIFYISIFVTIKHN